MYSKEEQDFIQYWEQNRLRKKKSFSNILIGLPIGMIIVIAIFINFFSGWYRRANMEANADPSVFIILLIAGVMIVAFYTIFTSYHKWDMNEKKYKELLSRKNHNIITT